MHAFRLVVAISVIALAVAACGGYTPGEDAVDVDVSQIWDSTEGAYAEGSYSYIRVERPTGDKVLEEQFDQAETLHIRLDPGTYRFFSFQRPCDGNCDSLDPPTDECERLIQVERAIPERHIDISVAVIPGEGCRFARITETIEID
jgi:hypothetical protein